MRQLATAPVHSISYEILSKNYGLGKHSSNDRIPDPKCLKNDEQNYATINEFILVVKLWVDFTQDQCATMWISMFFCNSSDACLQRYLHKTVL